MIFGLGIIAISFYLFYLLFIRGLAFGVLAFIFAAIGGKMLISFLFPETDRIAITFDIGHRYGVSWAACISVLISILGIGYFSQRSSLNE